MGNNIAVVFARCARANESPGFGIRMERVKNDEWSLTWAFPVKETSAKREGYDKTRIVGTFSARSSYPGCPHCEASNFFQCCCGKVGCWNGYASEVICPWCEETGQLSGNIEVLSAEGDA